MSSAAPERFQKAAGPPTAGGGLAELELSALAATRAAALSCQRWIGRGDPDAADAAATNAMRGVLSQAPGRGTVVIGEGTKDAAPMLYVGERLGRGGREFDIAVDPLECTKLCAKGMPGSLATIAIAEPGTMAALGPSFYMDKLVAPGAARGALDIERGPEENLRTVARALGKTVAGLRVVVLDKPRHEQLIKRVHAAGACVISPPDGDVAGSLAALLSTGEADLLMGVGGTPEGVMTACAARASGGCMQARLAPQREDEAEALAEAGLDGEQARSELERQSALATEVKQTKEELDSARSEAKTLQARLEEATGELERERREARSAAGKVAETLARGGAGESGARAGERIYELDELVNGRSFFAATGVTGGPLLRGPWVSEGQAYTESIVIADGSVRRVVEARGVST